MSNRQKCLSAFQRMRVMEESCNGYATCISCGKVIPVGEADGGHFIPRRDRATELLPENVHAQCIECNRFLSGNVDAYREGLIAKYGIDYVDRIENIKLANQGSDTARACLDEEDRHLLDKKTDLDYKRIEKQCRKRLRELF